MHRHISISVIVLAIAISICIPYVEGILDYDPSPNAITADQIHIDQTDFYLINYRNATNPTYDELIKFMRSDNTGMQTYAEAAIELHNNAEAAGIKTGVAEIEIYNQEYPYIVNVFTTQDKGLIYIQSDSAIIFDTDSIVTFSKNKECTSEYLFSRSPKYPAHTINHGVVKDCTIYW